MNKTINISNRTLLPILISAVLCLLIFPNLIFFNLALLFFLTKVFIVICIIDFVRKSSIRKKTGLILGLMYLVEITALINFYLLSFLKS